MPTDPRCRAVEERLTEAFLARREPDADDARHAEACPRCGRVRIELATLGDVLDASPPPAPLAEARAEQALRAARAALAAPVQRPAGQLAPGFGRELGRLLAFAVMPLPLLALWYAALLHFGAELLGEWLPDFLVGPVGLAFGIGAASWLGLVYASIPVVAHRRALRRNEVTA